MITRSRTVVENLQVLQVKGLVCDSECFWSNVMIGWNGFPVPPVFFVHLKRQLETAISWIYKKFSGLESRPLPFTKSAGVKCFDLQELVLALHLRLIYIVHHHKPKTKLKLAMLDDQNTQHLVCKL